MSPFFSDVFLSMHCFIDRCRRSQKRAEFCCNRNYNQGCCNLVIQSGSVGGGGYYNGGGANYNHYRPPHRPNKIQALLSIFKPSLSGQSWSGWNQASNGGWGGQQGGWGNQGGWGAGVATNLIFLFMVRRQCKGSIDKANQ